MTHRQATQDHAAREHFGNFETPRPSSLRPAGQGETEFVVDLDALESLELA